MDIPTLDKCPRYNLYIGGFIALRRPKALKNCHITHIVSVLEWQFEQDTPLLRGYQHLHIPVNDVEDENLLEWFPRSNAFIHEGLNYWRSNPDVSARAADHHASGPTSDGLDRDGSGVLIHCAMGKSRSATVLLAYLLWISRQPAKSLTTPPTDSNADMIALPPKPLSVIEALTLLRQGRPIAEPNEGFMDQLHLYEDMGCPTTQKELESHKLYRRWMNRRNVAESLRINRAPEVADIIFEDDDDDDTTASPDKDSEQHQQEIVPGIKAPDGTSQPSTSHPQHVNSLAASPGPNLEIKCRKCRWVLARSSFIIPHAPPNHPDPSSTPNTQCAHIFLHPLSWMKQTLSNGELDGRLSCPNPKCGANVGKFAWQGLRCSCGGWVTPGFGVARGKIDEIKVRGGAGEKGGGGVRQESGGITSPGGAALRLPPGMKKGNL